MNMNTITGPQTYPSKDASCSRTPVVQEREVPTALGKINFALEQLDAAVEQLHKRVQPLIRNVSPECAPAPKEQEMVIAPLALTLDNIAERILNKQREISAMDENIQL